jgi:uncharacterized protein with HEPN domain
MKPESAKWIYDILDAISDIERFTQSLDFEEYLNDTKTRAAVERKFEIIGEACTRLRDHDADVFKKISSAPQIIAFRNRLIHGYDQFDEAIVWDIIKSKLPELRRELPMLD